MGNTLSEEPTGGVICAVVGTISERRGAAYSACAGVCARDGATRGAGTHRDERKRAVRVDRDAMSVLPELGAGAVAVEEASSATAGERGDVLGGEVDMADAEVVGVLRCIIEENTER